MTNLRKLTNHEPHIVVWQKWMASRTKTVPGAELSKKNPSCLVALGPGLTAHGLWPRLQIFTMRSALDEELYLVHPKAQIAGLKRAQMAALKGLVWLPPRGCLETCLRWLRCHHSERFSCGFSGTKSSSFFFVKIFGATTWSENHLWSTILWSFFSWVFLDLGAFLESVRVFIDKVCQPRNGLPKLTCVENVAGRMILSWQQAHLMLPDVQ